MTKPVKKSASKISFKFIYKNILIFGIFLSFNLAIYLLGNQNTSSKLSQSPAFFTSPPIPTVKNKFPPILSTQNFIVIDSATNTILLGNKINDRIYPASTTKLATALTALNLYPLDEVITTTPYTEGKVMELKQDQKVTVKTLATALLVYSANDAAYNLANHYQTGTTGFTKQMNNLISKYNLNSTNFTNFDGIHDVNHYSTVYDLSQLARLALTMPFIVDTVKQKEVNLTDLSGDIKYKLSSTNELLGVVPEVEGLKTGWTPEASGCFIGAININGHKLVTVVAQSSDRFADTKKLIDWSKENITWNYRTY
jgi:D-alanyl-D-alanine carboxypeptidase